MLALLLAVLGARVQGKEGRRGGGRGFLVVHPLERFFLCHSPRARADLGEG